MKILVKSRKEFRVANRWDIDFHLPAEEIEKFPKNLWKRVDEVADVSRDKRDPTKEPEKTFLYIDISAVDVTVGLVSNPQDMDGLEAPSRARKVVSAFDILVSTCRPTRGAIAVVPIKLHDQIASTGFSIVRAHRGVNPYYLQFALRLPSTLEQFRKWSTGSSYPAILDSDVKKTIIPVPSPEIQDAIALKLMRAFADRRRSILAANKLWTTTLNEITTTLSGAPSNILTEVSEDDDMEVYSISEVEKKLNDLPRITSDNKDQDETELDDSEELLAVA